MGPQSNPPHPSSTDACAAFQFTARRFTGIPVNVLRRANDVSSPKKFKYIWWLLLIKSWLIDYGIIAVNIYNGHNCHYATLPVFGHQSSKSRANQGSLANCCSRLAVTHICRTAAVKSCWWMDGGVPLTFDLRWLEGGRGVGSLAGLPANSSVPLGSRGPFFRRADRGAGPRSSSLCFTLKLSFVFSLICEVFNNHIFFSAHRLACFFLSERATCYHKALPPF